MNYPQVRGILLLLWVLLFSCKSYAPDSSYGMGMIGAAINGRAVKPLFQNALETDFLPDFQGGLLNRSPLALQPDKINLHVVSLPAGDIDSAVITLSAPPGNQLPLNLQGATRSLSQSNEKELVLMFPPKGRQASMDWFNESGELERDIVRLVEEGELASELLSKFERIIVTLYRLEADTWAISLLEGTKQLIKHRYDDPEFERRAREAAIAMLEKILDMLFGDYVYVPNPEQCIYCPGPDDMGLGVAVVYFRPEIPGSGGPSAEHWQNWQEVIGGVLGATVPGNKKRRRNQEQGEGGVLKKNKMDDESLFIEQAKDRLLSAAEAENDVELKRRYKKYLDDLMKDKPKRLAYILDPHSMHPDFSSPSLHALLSYFYDTLSLLDRKEEPTGYVKELDEIDPFLMDTVAYMLHIALESPYQLGAEDADYVRRLIFHMEQVLMIEIPWQDRFRLVKKSMKEGLFTLPALPVAQSLDELKSMLSKEVEGWDKYLALESKPTVLSSRLVWRSIKEFKKELGRDTEYWDKMEDRLTDLKEVVGKIRSESLGRLVGMGDGRIKIGMIAGKLDSYDGLKKQMASVIGENGEQELGLDELIDHLYERLWMEGYTHALIRNFGLFFKIYESEHPDPLAYLKMRFVFKRALGGDLPEDEKILIRYLHRKEAIKRGYYQDWLGWVEYVDLELLPDSALSEITEATGLVDFLAEAYSEREERQDSPGGGDSGYGGASD